MTEQREMMLGDVLNMITQSDRVVIYNAAKQVIFRGYASTADYSGISMNRLVKKIGLGMETYRETDTLWDWTKIEKLPEQVPVEQFTEYQVEQLKHILFIRIELESDFEKR